MTKDPVTATPMGDEHNAPAGAFRIGDPDPATGQPLHILCVCPCGCGTLMRLPICTGTKTDNNWLWDGDREQPSLTPSIRDMHGCRFHGFLTRGVWTFCEDSGKVQA